MDVESGLYGQPGANSRLVHMALEKDRRNFIRKVYGTVGVQLAATAALAAPIATASDGWLEAHSALLLFSTFGFLAMFLLLFCGGANLMRKHPTNLIILAGFTLLEAISVGFICAMYEAQSVLLCLGATAAVAGTLTAFAATTEQDVTGMGGLLQAGSLGLFAFGLVGLLLGAPMLQMLYAFFGAVLVSAHLVYDTQLVVGGKHQKKKFGLDDYALAALAIYMDLVRLFLFLLRLLGDQRRQRR
mmetsp:Transcript_7427/g.18658  ORF Transcript_7427/g.18658 Transcript_7427/m.18658 type:complete len:244 (+) Transcript_7427:70-801(+)|eukprot:CAMPEP_0115452026 /NCGR_PEP_ID=MMETSP0271-20121206/42380_1 /TAXON_ID=71861 /ORGANISM="Scrippsiella trochoidea, Strain CCMP3099" /LENGTH=243 /DNA_ID=CAMNT_0002878337 /DNA_START=67 /DNA_END=798 /DNA_ORIENTATION=-